MAETSVSPASAETALPAGAAGLLAGILVFAPLIKGGNRPLPLLLLELAAIVLIAFLAVRPATWQRINSRLLTLLAGIALLPLIQLIPIPEGVWNALPGRTFYAESLIAAGTSPAYPAWSLIPGLTETAWLVMLVPVAVFLATMAADQRRLRQMANLFVGLALFQAAAGLAQFGTGWVAVFWPGGERIVRAQGTYANPDHLAGLLEMALPLALAFLVANVQWDRNGPARTQREAGLRQRLRRIVASGIRVNLVALYGAAALGILLGLVFSRSRTGIALAMLGILLCAILFSRHVGGQRSNRLITVFTVIGIALAAEIGLAPVLSGFSAKALTDPYRWSIYLATLDGIREFFPLGSGFGTFPWVFRRFHPGDVPQFVNHAHNDYLEWLLEGGVGTALIIAGAIGLYTLRWRAIWPRGDHWPTYAFLRIGAGIGIALISLHGLLDFNLHIPANAAYFAFLAGIFFHPEETAGGSPRARQPAPARAASPAPTGPPVAPPGLPAEPPVHTEPVARNPFAD